MLRASLLLALILAAGCSRQDVPQLNIPGGDAAETLKEFAKQANVEIIFDAKSVSGVHTNAAIGKMNAQDALVRMVADTPLSADQDKATGAFAVRRSANL